MENIHLIGMKYLITPLFEDTFKWKFLEKTEKADNSLIQGTKLDVS